MNCALHRYARRLAFAAQAATVAVVASGCAGMPRWEPDANFAAHPGLRGLVVDRMGSEPTAELVEAHPRASETSPTHVLVADGRTIAALWATGHERMDVREATDVSAVSVGEVVASHQQRAIRLAFRSAHGELFDTSRFRRVDRQSAPCTLDTESSISDLPGVYRAELRDEQKSPVGWLSVRILPYQGLPRSYEADVPTSLGGPLTAASFAIVDSEIASIIRRNAWPEDRIPEGLAP